MGEKGDMVLLQFPPLKFGENGDTVVYHKGLCRMRLHGRSLKVEEDDERIIAVTLRTDENLELFFESEMREMGKSNP